MEINRSEFEAEKERLAQTVALANDLLLKAQQANEENKAAIIAAKQELRENTQHSVGNLYDSDAFEALAAISQYINPVTDKINQYEMTENKIAMLKSAVNSPYFARIDFKYDDEDLPAKIYIGRSSLTKDSDFEMFVYDWRAPVSSMFYRFSSGRAYYDAPAGKIEGEISLKRQYEIKRGNLEYFFDADVQIVDEFLRKLLSQNTSSKMKAIVETIQKEQDIIIRDMENDLMMVQGVAGSGKTSVALHRAAYLMYRGMSGKLAANNIMIISPNTVFERYISGVLPELGEDNVISAVFEEILTNILGDARIQTRNRFLETLLTSKRQAQAEIMKSAAIFKNSPFFVNLLNRFAEDIPEKFIEFEDVFFGKKLLLSKEEISEKFSSGRKNSRLLSRLELIEEFILETAQEKINERGGKAEYQRIKTEIRKITDLNVKELYRRLFEDYAYFSKLCAELNQPESEREIAECTRSNPTREIFDYTRSNPTREIFDNTRSNINTGAIFEYTRSNLSAGAIFYDDAAAMAYLKLKLCGAREYRHIKQVVIDEAQDYYPLHFEIFALLFENAKYTVLGDYNQTLEKKEDLSLYAQIGAILKKQKASLVTMDKSFRCTTEILNFSASFLPHGVSVKSFNRTGKMPEILEAQTERELYEMILHEIENCVSGGYGSVAVICETEKYASKLYESIKDKTKVKLITGESGEEVTGVFVIPVYMSKGLEFDAVLVCEIYDNNLLYVACTRALHVLNVFRITNGNK
ncbi:MAG: AAA family ATPase [Clostridiales bacterium]|jgi:DNA helicase-2/ATP-dependent DNA helicase PcrA|nr:AAA family ATPase [Clostridiales bacterium]